MRILVGDIGATNSRFGIFDIGETVVLIEYFLLKTKEFNSFSELLSRLRERISHLNGLEKGIFGVAGPVMGEVARPPNIPFLVDLTEVRSILRIQEVTLVNDMFLYCWACLSPLKDGFMEIRRGASKNGSICLMAPGTGFGQALMVRHINGTYEVIPSEGGHSPFPFTTEEMPYLDYLRYQGIEATYDTVVSGPGLMRLYAFLKGKDLKPEEIGEALIREADFRTLFCRFLGRSARHLALTYIPYGGLYVGGGVITKNHGLLLDPEFEREFLNTEKMRHLLESVPLWLINHELSSLYGGAWYIYKQTEFS